METVPRRARRTFSAAEKLRIVREAERCLASGERGALEAMLRREGIYSSLLQSWRTKLGSRGAAGLEASKAGRKTKLTEPELRRRGFVGASADRAWARARGRMRS